VFIVLVRTKVRTTVLEMIVVMIVTWLSSRSDWFVPAVPSVEQLIIDTV